MQNVGKAIFQNGKWTFEKEFDWQGEYYKYMGDLDAIDDDYPIYSAEYQDDGYETKATLKKLCAGTNVDWRFLLSLLDWQHAESLFYELEDLEWFIKGA